MDERDFLRRRIFLKHQAIGLIQAEIEALEQRLALLVMKDSPLKNVAPEFDRELSAKLDCIDYLLRA